MVPNPKPHFQDSVQTPTVQRTVLQVFMSIDKADENRLYNCPQPSGLTLWRNTNLMNSFFV